MHKYVVESSFPFNLHPGYMNIVTKAMVKPLPEYVTKISLENTELHEQISMYKDFARDIAHALGMRLDARLCEYVEELKANESQRSLLRLKSREIIEALVKEWNDAKEELENAEERLEASADEIQNLKEQIVKLQHVLRAYNSEMQKLKDTQNNIKSLVEANFFAP